MASHLSAQTLKDLTRRYAYFLSFLANQGRLDLRGLPASSVTPENIVDYVRYLEPRVSSVTLAQSVYKIMRVAACLDPRQDWRLLRRVARRLNLRAKPRNRRHDVVEIKELYWLGRNVMMEADKASSTAFSRALLYRHGSQTDVPGLRQTDQSTPVQVVPGNQYSHSSRSQDGAGHDRAWASELQGDDTALQSGQDD
jgi:hypothetical protein